MIQIIKNFTRPVGMVIFPNIDYREQEISLIPSTHTKIHTRISSFIPIIRDGVYLIELIHRYERDLEGLDYKNDVINRFLNEVNVMQQKYIIQDIKQADNSYPEIIIYKMEY